MGDLNFDVGELVLEYMRKQIFPKGEYNKLKLKKIRPCKILRKFSSNAQELEFPLNIGISPIFNFSYLYPYKGSKLEISINVLDIGKDRTIQRE